MDCTFKPVGERFELAIERHFDHSAEKLWRVLTERELLRQWFPSDIVRESNGEWQKGEKLQFVFLHGEGDGLSEAELTGEVLNVKPNQLLEFSWGEHLFRCEIVEQDAGCLFRLVESFTDASIGARDAAGWEICFENLDLIIDGAEAALFVFDVWRRKFDRYVKKFEPEMGPQQGAPEDYPGAPKNTD